MAQRGSVLITGLMLTVALLMLLGLAVGVGQAIVVHDALVAEADDAALAGSEAAALGESGQLELDPATAEADALDAIPVADRASAEVDATTASVSVRLERSDPTILLRLVGIATVSITATATATLPGG
jgi:Tfp pilus assembly protein PilX